LSVIRVPTRPRMPSVPKRARGGPGLDRTGRRRQLQSSGHLSLWAQGYALARPQATSAPIQRWPRANRLPPPSPSRGGCERPDRPQGHHKQRSGDQPGHDPAALGQLRGKGGETAWKRCRNRPMVGEAVPPECRQLRKASAAPVPLRAPTPAIALQRGACWTLGPHHRGSGAVLFLGRQALRGAAPADPRQHPRTKLGAQVAAGIPIPARRRPACCSRAGAKAETPPPSSASCWVAGLGQRPSAGTWCSKTRRSGPTDLGQDGERPNFLWRQLLRAVPVGSGHRRCAPMRSVARNPARASAAAANGFPAHSRRA